MKKFFITLLMVLYWVVFAFAAYALGALFGNYVGNSLFYRIFRGVLEEE